ncbi:hypothetical protein GOODEAATRI_004389 [Goodea atripinnis]|uniref:Uncharacterized protein n=1 Tax=Goodea atripinnis TaxID=208336 RepID=A0ABV0MS80_9TELE
MLEVGSQWRFGNIFSRTALYEIRHAYCCFLIYFHAFSVAEIDDRMRALYEQTMKEWQGCEIIVRQREREKHAEALARCSSGASVERGPIQRDSTISTDANAVDSDDSLSALEMEDIPAGITCVTSENIKPRPLIGLAAPPISLAQREKMASEKLAQDHHLDTACNTSPEGTDLGLSEEEAEMDNVLTEPESGVMGGVTKYEESSEEQTYSVSIVQCKDILFLCYKHTLTTLPSFFSLARNTRHVLDQLASHRQRCQTLRQNILVLHY